MSNAKKRVYDSSSRKARAREARTRLLEAAKKLFENKGFDQTTIDEIAESSQMSAPTVYALFQSKRGVLRALMDEALSREQYEGLVAQVKKEQSFKKRLEIAAKISRQLYDAEKTQIDLLRGTSVLAPEFKELEAEREKRRYQRQEETLREMAEKGALAEGLTFTAARDILWTFTGRDLYRMLVIERGWTSDEYERWLADLLVKTLAFSPSLR